jgi:hypothetical protein
MARTISLQSGERLTECDCRYWIVQGDGLNCYVIAKVQHLRHAEEFRDIHGFRIYDPDLKRFI